MATKRTEIATTEVVKKPTYNSGTKMLNYDVIYDDEVKQYRNGFYTNYLKNKSSEFDTLYEVEAGMEHRLDLISYKFYDTATLDWAIADANNISDPIKDVTVGTILRIPSRNII